MLYSYIQLDGYRRFTVDPIKHFAMEINEPLQLILGTNGSGKSSLLSELTPLPPQHTDFDKETGMKIVRLTHNHHSYELKNTFSPSQRHSFVVDGEEKNDGGTITVQRELVKEHFGWDNDIQDLLSGGEEFTKMSASRRKEWFIRLCDTSYDYAIKVYNKLRERHRDAAGAIKLAKKRLVVESEKLIQSDEEARLLHEAKTLHECMTFLSEHRKPVERDLDTLSVEQEQLSDALFRTAKSLQALAEQSLGETLTLEMLEERIAQANNDRLRAQTLIEKHSADFRANQKKIDALQKAAAQTIETLAEDVRTAMGQVMALQSESILQHPLERAKTALEAFQTVRPTLVEVFSSIPSNEAKTYTQQAIMEAREKLGQLTVLKANLTEKNQALAARQKHMQEHKDHPDLQCPSCNHRFSLNYNETAYQQVVNQIETHSTRIANEVEPELKLLTEYLEASGEYAQLYRQYMACVSGWPILQPYWDHLTRLKTITDNPSSGIHRLSDIETDIHRQIQREELQRQIDEKDQLLTSLRDVGGADLNTLLQQNADLEVLLGDETALLQSSVTQHSKAQEAKQRLIAMEKLQERMTQFIQQKRSLNKEEIETARRIEFNNAVRQVSSALAQREHVLNSVAAQKSIVAHVTQQIFDLEQEEEALGILVKQLSPTEGLIAEGLLGFIRSFVQQMNAFISKIWTYGLEVQSCDVVEGATVELDYRFPLKAAGQVRPVSDVKLGSEGMLEVVNMAFRMIAMKYLPISDVPLMLDEWGKTFDAVHRIEAIKVIKALVDQHAFSQLFMVSHYESSYGALSNAEVCVLNDTNIVTPAMKTIINKHVVIVR